MNQLLIVGSPIAPVPNATFRNPVQFQVQKISNERIFCALFHTKTVFGATWEK